MDSWNKLLEKLEANPPTYPLSIPIDEGPIRDYFRGSPSKKNDFESMCNCSVEEKKTRSVELQRDVFVYLLVITILL